MPPPATPTTNGTNADHLRDAIGREGVAPPDPAWAPPEDPLAGGKVRARASVVHREIPLVSCVTGWDVPSARAALQSLTIGMFDAPAQLSDALMRSDSRVQSGLASRLSILGRPVDFRLPAKYRDSAAAKECRDAFVDAWPLMATEPVMSELQRWGIMMGFGVAQILWDTSGEYAIPHPLPWHPRYTYYHWIYRCYVAITMDGQTPIIPGDASWILHAPHGDYRGWMRGAVSSIAAWSIAREYALRDWARWSERHGLPMIKAMTPAVGDPLQQAAFRSSLARLGQETVLHLPQNPPPALSYDVALLEAADPAHGGFSALIAQCNMEITLALLAQNLTTEIKEGSYAAARVHADVRQSLLESDARGLALTMYQQLARPFAAMNFGDPDLAPRVIWDVTPFEDSKTKALALMQIAEAVNFFRVAGFKTTDIRRVVADIIPGFDIGELEDVAPVAIEAQQTRGQAAEKVAQQKAGAVRFDPGIMARVDVPRVRIAGGDSEELREAMAMAEAEADARKRRMRGR